MFKVGDRVRMVKNSSFVGHIGVIEHINPLDPNNKYRIEMEPDGSNNERSPGGGTYPYGSFELAEYGKDPLPLPD